MSNYKISSRIEISERCQFFYDEIYRNRNQYSPEQIYNTKNLNFALQIDFGNLNYPK